MIARINRPVVQLRWAPDVLLGLSAGAKRFNWLLNDIKGISDRVLTERLRDLEDLGLVTRNVDPGPPVRVSYSLTPAGQLYIAPLRQLQQVDLEVSIAS